ncbi:hypothetical protein A2J03_09895 [Rhodococcus sp. EPR-157]|uniref:hypothetical protein n=1 Tax=Rhodococcus sp. EPR-157 TaxID=1813677 RepID=UPI0007BC827C|nr:hypothetical protein [Rhodococcus sp. EPR-157]KZF00886.1 hypothetical protein A2J03_09895 [Rhodococcus sp. EPR-157]
MTIVNQSSVSLPPVKYTHVKLDDFTYEKFGQTLDGPAKTRLMKVARAKYADEIEQSHAIARAAQEELASVAHPLQATLDRIDSFSLDHPTALAPSAPVPWLETNRPKWADRDRDQTVFNTGDSHADKSSMSWRSQHLSVPLSGYYGKWHNDGRFAFADIRLDCRQGTSARETRIAFERHGWNGRGEPVDGVDFYSLTVSEAASMARALLLLVDLATGTTDEIAGA